MCVAADKQINDNNYAMDGLVPSSRKHNSAFFQVQNKTQVAKLANHILSSERSSGGGLMATKEFQPSGLTIPERRHH
jgi:selenophosphate synthase